MAPPTKRKLASIENCILARNNKRTGVFHKSNNENLPFNNNEWEDQFDNCDLAQITKISVGCQTEIEKRDVGIQMTDSSSDINAKFSSRIQPIISIHLLSLLCDLFRNCFTNWNSIHERIFSTIIYSVLRNFNVRFHLMGI
jgi:hypothetical protein